MSARDATRNDGARFSASGLGASRRGGQAALPVSHTKEEKQREMQQQRTREEKATMNKIKTSILGVVSALACALVLVLAGAVPALAADATTTGSITVTSDDNSTSTLYRIITVSGWDGTSAPTYTWDASVATWLKDPNGGNHADWVGENNVVTDKFNVADTGANANGDPANGNPNVTDPKNAAAQFFGQLSAAIKAGTVQIDTAAVTTGVETGQKADNLTQGSYLIVSDLKAGVTDKASIRIYNPTVVNLVPVEDANHVWSFEAARNVNVTIKSSTPIISKSQQVGTETDDVNGIGVGKQVTYTLKATVPSYPSTTAAGDKIFKIVDTMSKGLEFDADSVVIKDEAGNTLYSKDDKAAFDVTSTGAASDAKGTTATIAVKDFDATLKALANQAVTITYTATVTKDAVVSAPGMVNGATLHYGHDYTVESGKVKVYTFGLNVYKHGDDGTGDKALPDAQFELYTTNADGAAAAKINVSKNDDGTYYVDANGVAVLTTDANGHFKVYGLDEGTYALRETVAPAGFQKLQKDLLVTVTAAKADGAMNGDVVVGQDVAQHDYGYLPLDVKNTKGFSLPTTGGAGTLLLTAAGVVLLGGAALLMVRMRRQR